MAPSLAWAENRDFVISKDLAMRSISKLRELGLATGEINKPEFGIETKWELRQIQHDSTGDSFLIMRLVQYIDGAEVAFSREFDVLAMSQGQLRAFEEIVPIPDQLPVRIGSEDTPVPSPPDNSNYYYATLKDRNSVIAALKSLKTGIRYHGFSGIVISGASNIDPTPGRTWRVVDAEFSLRRGSTAEALDIIPGHFDDNFQAAWNGGVRTMSSLGIEGVSVAPYGFSSVLDRLDQVNPQK